MKLGTITAVNGLRSKVSGNHIYVESICPHCDARNDVKIKKMVGPWTIVCDGCGRRYRLE